MMDPGLPAGRRNSVNPRVCGKNLLFSNIFAANCMKMKEIGPMKGDVPTAPLDPPMVSIKDSAIRHCFTGSKSGPWRDVKRIYVVVIPGYIPPAPTFFH